LGHQARGSAWPHLGVIPLSLSLSLSLCGRLASQAENDSESTVNVVEFVARQQTVRLSQMAGIYRANLFDQHTGSRAFDLYFRPEGGRKGVRRRRGDDDRRQG